ncbi:MAG TPA: carbohydrate ABC transporter permease, partial [Thermoanaerobacter sp.]|nr:carbohydrate ABC transporter permease [Thermoanaerobacter sp.]
MRKIDISEKISNTAYIPIAIIAAILMVIPVYILFMTSFAVPSDIL